MLFVASVPGASNERRSSGRTKKQVMLAASDGTVTATLLSAPARSPTPTASSEKSECSKTRGRPRKQELPVLSGADNDPTPTDASKRPHSAISKAVTVAVAENNTESSSSSKPKIIRILNMTGREPARPVNRLEGLVTRLKSIRRPGECNILGPEPNDSDSIPVQIPTTIHEALVRAEDE